MLDWSALSQQLQKFIKTFVRLVKARRREEAVIGIAAILFWIGHSFIGWLPEGLQGFVKSWHGDLIISAVLYAAGLGFLGYGAYRLWRLVAASELPPVTNRPTAIKGPGAFTPADGRLFRKLGREDDLRKLLGYVRDDQVSLIVLMGASGAGKTSLIRAGLTDILQEHEAVENGMPDGERQPNGKPVRFHYWEAVATDSGNALLRAIQESWHPNANGDSPQANPALPAQPESLDDLVNPSPSLVADHHVIVLDQFEQLRGNAKGPVFRLLRKVARQARPPHRITWVIVFRREFRADWSDFIIPEQERGFHPPELSLRLFTPEQAREVIGQIIQAAGLSVEQDVVDNLIEAATVEGEVSSVDIGIGLLVLAKMYDRQAGATVTEEAYHFAGGAEGVLTQYISRCLDSFSDEDREIILKALLALRDPETDQRIAEGKTCDELAAESKAESNRLKTQLERLTQRDMRLLEHADTGDDGGLRYRLPHERLIPALNRLAGNLIGEAEEAKVKFVNAFSAWKKHHASQYLLRGKDLRLVERNKGKIAWGKDEQEKDQFLKRSQRQRILRRFVAVLLIILLTTGGWLANSQYQIYTAKEYLRDNNYPPELYDYQQQLKVLKLKETFNVKRFPWLRSNSLEEFSIKVTGSTNSLEGLGDCLARCSALKKLTLDLSDSQVSNLEPLAKLTNLSQLALDLSGSQVSNLEPLLKLGCQALDLTLTTEQRQSLKTIPKSVTSLSF